MIALNRDEVRGKSVRFWILFALLLLSTLIVTYFFVWAAQRENASYIARLDELHRIENKQTIFQNDIKKLYDQIENLSSLPYLDARNKIDIANTALGIRIKIGADSATSFSGYYTLLKGNPVQLNIVDTLLTLLVKKEILKEKLDRCSTNKTKRINPFLDRNR